MNARRARWLAALLALAGCPHALPPAARPYAPPTAEALLDSLRARAGKIRSIDASAKAEESAPGTPRVKVRVQIDAERPDRLRLEVEAPLGGGAATLVTDGADFRLLDAREGRFLRGAAEPCNVARLIQVELPPRAIVDLLLGSVPLDGLPVEAGWDPSEGGRELLTLRDDDGATTKIWLDARGRRWDPVRAERRDARGAPLWRIEHADFVERDGVRLPGRTAVEDPRRRATVKLRYREPTVNPSLPAAGFSLEPPAGLPVEQVDCR